MKSDSSEAKKRAACAISSGFPILLTMDSSIGFLRLSGFKEAAISVSVSPGQIAFTFTYGPKLTASDLVKPIKPAFETA